MEMLIECLKITQNPIFLLLTYSGFGNAIYEINKRVNKYSRFQSAVLFLSEIKWLQSELNKNVRESSLSGVTFSIKNKEINVFTIFCHQHGSIIAVDALNMCYSSFSPGVDFSQASEHGKIWTMFHMSVPLLGKPIAVQTYSIFNIDGQAHYNCNGHLLILWRLSEHSKIISKTYQTYASRNRSRKSVFNYENDVFDKPILLRTAITVLEISEKDWSSKMRDLRLHW